MKKILAVLLLAGLLFSSALADDPDAAFAAYEDYGAVLSVFVSDEGALIEAEGYWGYHMDEDPSMTVNVLIRPDCTIQSVSVAGSKAQTPGFDTQITEDYLEAVYAGKTASAEMDVDAVTGATATSQAVLYAVRTAAYYAQNALGYVADTDAAEKAELNEVFAADYTTVDLTGFETDAKKLGTVLYAAHGVSAEGKNVFAMKIKSMTKPDQSGSARTGWTAAMPNPFTMIIVIDEETDCVCAWKIAAAGYKASSYFAVPDELIDNYKTVVISDASVFDNYLEGSIMSLEYETTPSDDGPVITGTSIVYTGKTEQGTFSSQFIRSCFRTAAALYCEKTAK